MEQRVSLITLAVVDLDRAAAFYDALGWQRVETPDGLVVYDLLGQSLGLYPKAELARDMGLEPEKIGGFSGITLAHNTCDKAGVDAVMAAAQQAGARIIRPAHDMFWGGYVGYFADPDGHVWEVAHNPFSPLGSDGAFQWGGAG